MSGERKMWLGIEEDCGFGFGHVEFEDAFELSDGFK